MEPVHVNMEEAPVEYDRAGYLSLLAGRMLCLGREVHAALQTESYEDRRARHATVLNETAALIRDMETLAAFDRGDQRGGAEQETVTDQDLPALWESGGQFAEIEVHHLGELACFLPGAAEKFRVLISQDLLELLFREALLVVSTASKAPVASIHTSFTGDEVSISLSPESDGEDLQFFKTVVGNLITSRNPLDGPPDILRIRVFLMRAILEHAGGQLGFDSTTGEVVIDVPGESASSVLDGEPLSRLARSFFA
jgi:hypothetical protein